MRRKIVRYVLRHALSILIWTTALSCSGLGSPPISESQVKAAYLYNFAKFIEWPEQAFSGVNSPIRMCVLNDSSFETTLKEIVKSRSIDGHPVLVVDIQTLEDAHACHILFINATQDSKARSIILSLRNVGVVTVGETQGFIEQGGIINFALKDGRVQFQVNLKAATQAGLHISARLLAVANMVDQ